MTKGSGEINPSPKDNPSVLKTEKGSACGTEETSPAKAKGHSRVHARERSSNVAGTESMQREGGEQARKFLWRQTMEVLCLLF